MFLRNVFSSFLVISGAKQTPELMFFNDLYTGYFCKYKPQPTLFNEVFNANFCMLNCARYGLSRPFNK